MNLRSCLSPRKCGLVLLLIINFLIPQANAAPNVVVSIPPVHSLVSSVMKGVAEPTLLIPGGQSPHSYSLKPSAVRQLVNADLLVWISPEFELSLRKVVTQQRNLGELALIEVPRMHVLHARQSNIWQMDHATLHQSYHAEPETTDASAGVADMHLWLSADNALTIVSAVEQRLSVLDPPNAHIYHSNSLQVRDKINNTKLKIARSLQEIKAVPYVVFHDAYQYFEHEFDLNPVGTVTLSPERKPGVKTLLAIEQSIRSRDARCIFHEPQFEPRLLTRIAEDTDIRTGELDPVGAALQPGPELWFELMGSLKDNLLKCLQY